METKLNIGCGRKHFKGFINMDCNPNVCPDIVRDLNKGLPFSDNSVDQIVAIHFLEHVDDIQFTMYEIWRVLKPGAKLLVIVPIGKNWQTYPEHKAPFDSNTVIAFTDWNVPEDSGYKFKGVAKSIIHPEGRMPKDYFELHFILEKQTWKSRPEVFKKPEQFKFIYDYKEDKMAKRDRTGPPRNSTGPRDGRGQGKGRNSGKGTGAMTGGRKGIRK